MKPIFTFLILMILSNYSFAQNPNPQYDKELADSLGADQYGMKAYILAILKTGPAQIEDKEKISELFRGHIENINKLADENKLIVAGPMGKNDNSYRGIFILNVKTKEEAAPLVENDPAVKEGLLAVDFYEWYGSAALPVYLETSKKITKENP